MVTYRASRHPRREAVQSGAVPHSQRVRLDADVDAVYNILQKAVPKAFYVDEIESVGLYPEGVPLVSMDTTFKKD